MTTYRHGAPELLDHLRAVESGAAASSALRRLAGMSGLGALAAIIVAVVALSSGPDPVELAPAALTAPGIDAAAGTASGAYFTHDHTDGRPNV